MIRRAFGFLVPLVLCGAFITAAFAQNPPAGLQQPTPIVRNPGGMANQPIITEMPPPINAPLSLRQKNAIVVSNFKNTERDVAKLQKLVQTLDKEMKKSNPNILSVGIVRQAAKIEKLAKKIKNEAKEY